jgi:hypothetical protein
MSGWLYLAAWVGTLADQLAGVRQAGVAAGLALLAFLLVELPRQKRALRLVFAALVAVGLAGVALAAEPGAAFLAAWRRGAAYAAFYLALGALRDAAETSALVRRCGLQLVAQPAGRRSLALMGGGHLFGMILSYGVIDLFGAMITRAEGAAVSLRRRVMMLAVYRGFATMNCWSPLTIMTIVVSAAVPAAATRPLMAPAFAVAMAMLAVGWWEQRRFQAVGAAGAASGERWSIHLGIIALVLVVMALAEVVAGGFAVSLSLGITAMAPVAAAGWVLGQSARRRARWALLWRRVRRFRARLPRFRGEAAVLGASGFVGVALGAALPAGGVAPLLAGLGLPSVAVPLLVPVLLLASGAVGLNPIVTVAVIGAAVPDPLALGVAPPVLAFACMLGWGLAAGSSPVTASALTTARWLGSDPWTVTLRWNGRYTLAALLVQLLAILVAQWAWSP